MGEKLRTVIAGSELSLEVSVHMQQLHLPTTWSLWAKPLVESQHLRPGKLDALEQLLETGPDFSTLANSGESGLHERTILTVQERLKEAFPGKATGQTLLWQPH